MQMSLKTKLIVLVLFPHLAIIGLAGEAIYQQLDSKEKLRALVPLQDIATTASGIIHELQSERGRTVGVISSGFAADRRGDAGAELGPGRRCGCGVTLDDHALPAILEVQDTARVGDEVAHMDRVGRTVVVEPTVQPRTPPGHHVGAAIGTGGGHPVLLGRRQPVDHLGPRQDTVGGLGHAVPVGHLWTINTRLFHRPDATRRV